MAAGLYLYTAILLLSSVVIIHTEYIYVHQSPYNIEKLIQHISFLQNLWGYIYCCILVFICNDFLCSCTIFIYCHYPFELLVPLNSNITTFQILACVMFFLVNRIILVFTLLVTELKTCFWIFFSKKSIHFMCISLLKT
jgi:hypothetical protein